MSFVVSRVYRRMVRSRPYAGRCLLRFVQRNTGNSVYDCRYLLLVFVQGRHGAWNVGLIDDHEPVSSRTACVLIRLPG